MSKTLRPWTLSEYMEKQPLIPHVVALNVAQAFNLGPQSAEQFARYAESRMIAVFNHNKSFRRKMLGPASRTWLYAFTEHWCEAWVKAQLRAIDAGPKKVDINELFGKE